MKTYIEVTDKAFNKQLDFFCGKVGSFAAILGLNATKIAALQATNELVKFVAQANQTAQNYARSYVTFKNVLRRGKGAQILGAVPVPPVYATAPPAVTSPNAQAQFASLIQDCVRSSNFSENIGASLGIIKPESNFDPQAGKPVLKVALAQGGHPLLRCKKGKYEAFEIWKDKNDGNGYQLAGVSLHPTWLDHAALPAPGVAVSWKYRVIYVYENKQAGSWSNVVMVSVYGNV